MLQSCRICILIVLQVMPFCVQISFVFNVLKCLIYFINIELLRHQTWTKSLFCVFICIVSKLTEKSILPKWQLRPCCIHMTRYRRLMLRGNCTPNQKLACLALSQYYQQFFEKLYASCGKLFKKLRNSIKIWVGQAVLDLLIKQYFDCFDP